MHTGSTRESDTTTNDNHSAGTLFLPCPSPVPPLSLPRPSPVPPLSLPCPSPVPPPSLPCPLSFFLCPLSFVLSRVGFGVSLRMRVVCLCVVRCFAEWRRANLCAVGHPLLMRLCLPVCLSPFGNASASCTLHRVCKSRLARVCGLSAAGSRCFAVSISGITPRPKAPPPLTDTFHPHHCHDVLHRHKFDPRNTKFVQCHFPLPRTMDDELPMRRSKVWRGSLLWRENLCWLQKDVAWRADGRASLIAGVRIGNVLVDMKLGSLGCAEQDRERLGT